MYFLKLCKLSKDAHMKPEHVIRLLQIANEYLPVLELKYKKLKKDIDSLEFEKQKLRGLGNHVGVLADVSEKYEKEIKNLHREKTRLENLVKKFENANEYKKIRQTTEEEVTKALSNRKDLLKLAISCVTEAMIGNPNMFNFLVNNYSGQRTSLQPSIINVYRTIILQEAEKLLDAMAGDLSNKIINAVI